ncbi:MAG: tetratricopeptide repeat protein, partial [Actinomycetota bacterium]|nr:tetratricopeptide repeat protein [Actinomycetota bacterium]
ARLDLGRALAAAGVYDEAMGHLVEAARRGPAREEARDAVLEVFRLLGDDHALVKAFRPKLAAALF